MQKGVAKHLLSSMHFWGQFIALFMWYFSLSFNVYFQGFQILSYWSSFHFTILLKWSSSSADVLLLLVKIGKLQIQPCNFGNDAFLPPLHFHAWQYPPLQYYILHPMKSAILGFSDRLVVAWKYSHALICLPHAVSFGMQFKSDHLIRQVVEIQSLELHFLWDFFFKCRITLFMWRRE